MLILTGWFTSLTKIPARVSFSFPRRRQIFRLARADQSFTGVAATSGRTRTFSGSGDAQRLKALFVPGLLVELL
jgi:hypothetical protein